ncbi:TonB-dependent receptor [Halosquirtibacter laminarini]|uniref:TonB-dependent receptor n=1 Tax=Halosquirtibacter laminarini TaxID=3374600 RepID=A0AC61NBV7_9BACT|nr:TonB-dependent receptor [Prolixibacteraceae bacterium]
MHKIIPSFKGSLYSCSKKIGRILTVCFIILSITNNALIANTYIGQRVKISVNLKQVKLSTFFTEIENKTDFQFFYDSNDVDVEDKISVSKENKDIDKIMSSAFKKSKYDYEFVDRYIVIKSKSPIESNTSKVSQQVKTIKGKVSERNGNPLPGVSISLKGTTKGIVSDIDGNFTLSGVSPKDILVFSFIGMKTKEVLVGNIKSFSITLEEDAIGINEVVAIGYGSKKKATLTGAVSNVKADEIEKIPSSNVSASLYGRMAGVNISSPTGTPGVSSNILIRAKSTWNNTNPIYVIDGIIRDKASFDRLDPVEIDQISILKDAAAAAVYGARSANGAVVVTTKNGAEGAPSISFTSSYSIEEVSYTPKFMDNALEINKFFNSFLKPGQNGYSTQEELDWLATQNGGKGWNWFDEAKEKPRDQRYAVNVSGGSKKVRYFMSGAYYDQKGIIDALKYNRHNLRAKIDVDITDNLTVGLQLANVSSERRKYNFQYDYGNDALPDVFSKLFYYNWDKPPYIDGKPVNIGWVGHPIELMKNSGYWLQNITSQEAIMNAKYKIPFIKGLTAGFVYSKNVRNTLTKSLWKKHTVYNFKTEGANNKIYTNELLGSQTSSSPNRESLYNGDGKYDNYQMNANLNFNRKFGDHSINANFIYEQAEGSGKRFTGKRYDFPLIFKDQWFATSSDNKDSSVGGYEYENGRLSYIGVLDYNYKEKYMISGSVRRDGSMKFAKDKRWGWFPSGSAAWRISEESFFKDNIEFINYMKVRGSVGLLGDDSVSPYQWQDTYATAGGFLFGDDSHIGKAPGAQYKGLPNKNITWEKSLSVNYGLDMSLFDSHLSITAELWNRKNYDILKSRIVSLPTSVGASMPDENYAEIKSHGYELEVRYNNTIKDLNYYIGATFAYATNEVVKLDVAENVPDYKNPIGRSLDYVYSVQATDIIRSQAELDALPEDYRIFGYKPTLGMINYEDISGPEGKPDNKIDAYDNQVLADHSIAPYNGSVLLGVSWKGISLDMVIQGAFGNKKMYQGLGRQTISQIRPAAHWRDAWSEDNPDGEYPVAGHWHKHPGYMDSSFWLKSGAYMRLKNLNLGYKLPKSWTKGALGIEGIQVYFNTTNLFTLSEFTNKGWYDPELSKGENYPNMKKYTFGLNVTL